ncbi:uncharacterized protein LOC127280494 [Leptopilina boulardi]|uniref:uncharacterized protein LOC127280494 n=1 Tax=Leptopilina boulardi TaxID=63433 RepID=UPI0021F67628|nr:uncharacterized protein LOC127280494 [Leptopilina boulardi]
MEDSFFTIGPLATVQLVPIISYINILSDFLFMENYLAEFNQNKEIPIVNALYEYLDDNRYNNSNNMKLIRKLLKGSDLYGEQDNENVDHIFVKTMFNYIISSLVFVKYGNIYGFLAEAIGEMENLQFDYALMMIKEKLRNAKFANEYGIYSSLSNLAMNRIYKDIILQFFPQPNTNLSLLSLDYIFAQAGFIYLQLGRINDTYFSEQNYNYNEIDLFNKYLTLGDIVKNLLHHEKIDPLTLRIFALPALFYYTLTMENIKNNTISKIIFEPHHWKAAYDKFFEYLNNTFVRIENQLKTDTTYRIHLEFLNFYNHNIDDNDKLSKFESKPKFEDEIRNIGELYEKYYLEIVQQLFSGFSIPELRNVVITLLISDNNEFTNTSYDLLEFYYVENQIYDYYALIQENYSFTLIKDTNDSEFFLNKLNLTFHKIIKSGHRTILKYANESRHELIQELMKNKKDRFKIYLNNFKNKNNEWWKEFGLSLMPIYPCTNIVHIFCTNFGSLQKEVSHLMNKNTKSLLSSLGTTIETIFLKNVISAIVDKHKSKSIKMNNTVYDQFSLHIEEPAFVSISTTQTDITLMSTIVADLEININNTFSFVKEMLNNIQLLKITNIKQIPDIDDINQSLFVKTGINKTGFGYKFTILDRRENSFLHALLRTDYEMKNKIFITSGNNLLRNKNNAFIKLNKETLEYDYQFVYEINNQLRRKSTTIIFSGIITPQNIINENCNNNNNFQSTNSDVCPMNLRSIEKNSNERQLIRSIKIKTLVVNTKFIFYEDIKNILKKYYFPNDNITLYFLENWLNNPNFQESDWCKNYLIENIELFNKLMYTVFMDKNNLSLTDAENKINSIYTYRERCKIEKDTSLENIINDYNQQKAYYSVTFEDYYAIRNFATSDIRISQDTSEAKEMKIALYKLAIRQFEGGEFQSTLYRVETKPMDFKELYEGKRIFLQKFTKTSTNIGSAIRFSSYPANGFRNIFYEYQFDERYFNTEIEMKVNKFEIVLEKNIILLPSSEFIITRITNVTLGGMGNVSHVVLSSVQNSTRSGKHEWYKNIMKEITKINVN